MISPKLQVLIKAVVDSARGIRQAPNSGLSYASTDALEALAAHNEDSAYVDSGGNACPNCGSTEGIDWIDNLECDGTIVWNAISCCECGAAWSERYDLTDAVGIEVPKDWEDSDG